MQEKHVYIYQGSVFSFNREVSHNWKASTTAASEKQARNNLLFRARKMLGLAPHAKLSLTGKLELCE